MLAVKYASRKDSNESCVVMQYYHNVAKWLSPPNCAIEHRDLT